MSHRNPNPYLLLAGMFAVLSSIVTAPIPVRADQAAPSKVLVDISAAGSETKVVPDNQARGQVTVARSDNPAGVLVTVAPGVAGFPGVEIKPDSGKEWDLSAYGHIESRITNLGTTRLALSVNISDNVNPDEPVTNVTRFSIEPGKTVTCNTVFGYSYGATCQPVNTSRVSSILMFTGRITTAPVIFRIETLNATGPSGEKLPVNPDTIETRPPGGVLVGPGIPIAPKQLAIATGASARVTPDTCAVEVAFSAPGQSVTLKPSIGMWQLNDKLEVKVKLKNIGQSPVSPTIRMESRSGPSDAHGPSAPLAPGAETEIVVPFAATTPWKGPQDPDEEKLEVKKNWTDAAPGNGTNYSSCFTKGVTILADSSPGPKALRIESIVADLPPYSAPEWLGTRPPVDGDWVQTFNDDFSGTAIDLHKWNIYNYDIGWHLGAGCHYTKDNVIVKDGKLTLRMEKKYGHHNDDPSEKANSYATGFADTFGKWTQRYGYFEAKMKLPTAPYLSFAFWLMPDRGPGAEHRPSTRFGGMEFDTMEALSLWGPYRHDFGMHWDGYTQYHKSLGEFGHYTTPDKDGYITVGMLWTPGTVVEYDNGKETARWESPRVSNVEEYIILDLTTGGWETEPLDDKQFPADFTIAYVRAWQRHDLASPGDGPKPNQGNPRTLAN